MELRVRVHRTVVLSLGIRIGGELVTPVCMRMSAGVDIDPDTRYDTLSDSCVDLMEGSVRLRRLVYLL